jgi:hypothetical protein
LAIAIVSFLESGGECRIGVDPGIHLLHSAHRLQTSHSSHREGTGEPEPGGEGCPVIEHWWNRYDHRKTQWAPSHHLGEGPERAPDLGSDNLGINRQLDQRR